MYRLKMNDRLGVRMKEMHKNDMLLSYMRRVYVKHVVTVCNA